MICCKLKTTLLLLLEKRVRLLLDKDFPWFYARGRPPFTLKSVHKNGQYQYLYQEEFLENFPFSMVVHLNVIFVKYIIHFSGRQGKKVNVFKSKTCSRLFRRYLRVFSKRNSIQIFEVLLIIKNYGLILIMVWCTSPLNHQESFLRIISQQIFKAALSFGPRKLEYSIFVVMNILILANLINAV